MRWLCVVGVGVVRNARSEEGTCEELYQFVMREVLDWRHIRLDICMQDPLIFNMLQAAACESKYVTYIGIFVHTHEIKVPMTITNSNQLRLPTLSTTRFRTINLMVRLTPGLSMSQIPPAKTETGCVIKLC